jgi:hypothetical protein
VSRTAERNPLFQRIGPILERGYAFVVKADSKIAITSMSDAKPAFVFLKSQSFIAASIGTPASVVEVGDA